MMIKFLKIIYFKIVADDYEKYTLSALESTKSFISNRLNPPYTTLATSSTGIILTKQHYDTMSKYIIEFKINSKFRNLISATELSLTSLLYLINKYGTNINTLMLEQNVILMQFPRVEEDKRNFHYRKLYEEKYNWN